jgi:nicotinamide-nucleotide amidase
MTCGWVQAKIGAISGVSAFFRGGMTAYSLDQKVRHLGVDRAMAEAVHAVSAVVAEQMALGACTLFGSDVALATTGYAEPAPAFGAAEPGAWWALAELRAGRVSTVRSGWIDCPGADRRTAQQRVAAAAIAALVSHLRDPAIAVDGV